MTFEGIKRRLLQDDTFVQSHIEQILVWYNLKRTIRYNETRITDTQSESVAEHVYGMHLLADYFLPLEEARLDNEKIRQLITWHDMAEAVVGDMTSETKTDQHKAAELQAEETLASAAPEHLHVIKNLFTEFNSQETLEAKFVRAIDKLEPVFHLVFISRQSGFKPFQWGWTAAEDKQYRDNYTETFPLLLRFDDILSRELNTAGYFIK